MKRRNNYYVRSDKRVLTVTSRYETGKTDQIKFPVISQNFYILFDQHVIKMVKTNSNSSRANF